MLKLNMDICSINRYKWDNFVRIKYRETYQEGKRRQKSTIRLYIAYLYFLLACGIALPTYATDLPHEFTAHYKLTKGIITLGKTRRSFKITASNEFIFESISRPSGVGKIISNGEIYEKSHAILHNNVLRPLSYSYRVKDSDLKRDVRINFDWEKHVVVNNINGDPWKMDLEDNTQDKLLYLLSLMIDLKKGKQNLEYKVADGGITKTYHAIIEGEQNIDTDLGTFTTIKIVRKHHDGKRTILWCAASLEYIPLRIEQIKKDGSTVRASLYNLEGIPIQGRIVKKPR